MGQAAGVGCSFGTLHLCASEDASGAYVLPSRCGGATGSHSHGSVAKSHNLDLAPDSWQLGTSTFGTVLRAAYRASGEPRALRAVPKRRCERERLLRELEVLRALDHPNLVRVAGVVEDPRMIWIIMESAPGKDLLTAVTSSRQTLSEWLIAQLLRQLLLGLQHLHAAGLVHQDVQPRNVLASTRPTGQELRLKLIDFGLAGKYSRTPGRVPMPLSRCAAPEQVGGSLSPRTLSMEPGCDIWAVGTISFALLSGQWPIDAENADNLRKKLSMGLWAFVPATSWAVSDQAKALVSSLLTIQPGQRPTAAQALEHPFLRIDGLDKRALQPLARSQEVQQSLLRLSSRQLLQDITVNALAMHLHEKQLAQLRRHLESLDPTGRGLLTLLDLRRGLVEAGVQLPGRLLGALLALRGDEARGLRAEDLAGAAVERRQGLEEVLLWATWSLGAPEGAAALRREEAMKLLEQNSSALSLVFGTSAPALAASEPPPPLPEPADFEALLRWARAASARRGAATGRWPLPSGARMSSMDLSIRIPPPMEIT
mmetsp:Transcript_89870/g.262672  ORF Transcript_89870/g.262672 Transcript_89870/m.262672 type:complete len:541 (-) Transcript_89870:33-1655(-)